MLTFPSAIEQSLLEADGDTFTVRQLSMRTGKSTGVLSEAVKKLMRKDIVSRQILNEAPCYLLRSIDCIAQWFQQDIHCKKQTLLRRHQDFLAFLSSLSRCRERPDLMHFDGSIGIVSAYRKLLTVNTKELFCFLPILHKEEEHSLRDFLKRFTLERKKHGMFLNIIANDTVLGRRFQTRDPFEYRRTTLIPENILPISCERIIADDTVACFDCEKQCASFLNFPQLAEAERALFHALTEEREAPAPMLGTSIDVGTREDAPMALNPYRE